MSNLVNKVYQAVVLGGEVKVFFLKASPLHPLLPLLHYFLFLLFFLDVGLLLPNIGTTQGLGLESKCQSLIAGPQLHHFEGVGIHEFVIEGELVAVEDIFPEVVLQHSVQHLQVLGAGLLLAVVEEHVEVVSVEQIHHVGLFPLVPHLAPETIQHLPDPFVALPLFSKIPLQVIVDYPAVFLDDIAVLAPSPLASSGFLPLIFVPGQVSLLYFQRLFLGWAGQVGERVGSIRNGILWIPRYRVAKAINFRSIIIVGPDILCVFDGFVSWVQNTLL